MADSSRSYLAYVAETVWGTTPGTPSMILLRTTSMNFRQVTETAESQELRPDRQIPDVIRVGASAQGDFNFELSYGSLDDMIEALLAGTWTADVLTQGVTPRSFTFEQYDTDGAAFDAYSVFRGCRVGQASLNLVPNAIATGSMSVLGAIGAVSDTALDAAPTAAPTNEVMNAVDNITVLNEGGAPIANVMRLELSFENNLRDQPALSSLSGIGIGYGRFRVSGTLEAYFRNIALYEKYLDFTASSLAFTVEDAAGNSYAVSIPRIKYTEGEKQAGGNDQDIILRLPFTAMLDSGAGHTIQITRTPAV